MDEACLQAARRGVIFEYIERVSRGTHPNLCDGSVPPLTYSSIHHSLFCYHVWCAGPAAAVQSFLNYFRGMPPTFCWDLMAAVEDVTTEQVRPYFLGREKGTEIHGIPLKPTSILMIRSTLLVLKRTRRGVG